jgi:hypothetical protein
MPEGTYPIKLCYSHVLIFLLEMKKIFITEKHNSLRASQIKIRLLLKSFVCQIDVEVIA